MEKASTKSRGERFAPRRRLRRRLEDVWASPGRKSNYEWRRHPPRSRGERLPIPTEEGALRQCRQQRSLLAQADVDLLPGLELAELHSVHDHRHRAVRSAV